MLSCTLSTILLVIIYALIIISIPLFLDYILSNMKKNCTQKIFSQAKKKSNELNKPIILFQDKNHGIIINNNEIESFDGDIVNICKELDDSSCILILYEVLEYINDPDDIFIKDLVHNIKRISGDDFYIININKHSPKIYLDHNILNIMDKDIYQFEDKISYRNPSKIEQKIQNIYRYFFKIVPYENIKHGLIKWDTVENQNN
ncbi:hypothetical protein H012_gp619 [Acanthamoeba polyphaga moumouvirus]|uniref:Uncharacterized protein n=1 Tax=Acanthamoeba polyphaga moumouvirus TaxID=1269028 RepID=L7RBH7_9VIRU|nr:hypothetical protein H012_gp619 [Acanthamoeba polyphaga moumouvirus]AGC01844.1 hypothetical protein Moumou_00304 [Acanthamoeba polyphaga moumouvirus]AQN68203.1 hypothetical protein [Saudi moumouvirus]